MEMGFAIASPVAADEGATGGYSFRIQKPKSRPQLLANSPGQGDSAD